MTILSEAALSSMPNDRRQVVDLLLQDSGPRKSSPRGQVSSSEIAENLAISKPTALRVIEELRLLDIGEKTSGMGNQSAILCLNPAYDWLTSDTFISYRNKWRELYCLPF